MIVLRFLRQHFVHLSQLDQYLLHRRNDGVDFVLDGQAFD